MLSYGTQVWSLYHAKNIKIIERVQTHFTKSIRGLNELDYKSRLLDFKTFSLQKHRKYTDMVFIYKALHGKINCEPEDLRIVMSHNCTRGGQCSMLVQRRPPSTAAASLFSFRATSAFANQLLSLIARF